jgi:DNA-binding winged helix-turn-helix (wHTH) protein/TolB-like protein/Tfp pilus assembly protein PilF
MNTSRSRLRIGEWIADPATNELRRGDEVVRIEPKAMDLLMLLAERPGAVVSREELFSGVWPGLVVGDEALTQSVAKLRRALRDDPRSPAYIETLSKRGYRLVASVRADTAEDAREFRPAPRTRAALLAGPALLVAAALLAVLWPRDGEPPSSKATGLPAHDAAITVTVIPFESLGPGREDRYLARGIAEDLVSDLARLSSLRLIRSAEDAQPADAARNARYVVSGSVQRGEAALRIHVRLVDARTNEVLWSERFERPAGDLFAIQDEIARHVAKALPTRVSEVERQRLARRYTNNLAAYDDFLRAQALFLARGARENGEARGLYQRALQADPKFARAYAGLAMTHAMDHRLREAAEAKAGLARALELAETAAGIDPDIPEVHWALGFIHAQARRHDRALESLRRAVELNPSFADAYALMGGIHTYTGEPAKTIPLVRTAMRLNPDGGYLYFLILGRAYLFENDLEQALINLRQAQARNPADVETRIFLAAALAASGDRAAAQWEAEEIRSLERGFALPGWLEAYPLASPAHRDRLRQWLETAGV